MDIGTIIGSSIVILIIGFWTLIIYRTKDRKTSLTIMKDEDKIKMFLSDDDYYEFDISNIKDDKQKIYDEIKGVIQRKSKELVVFVDRVTFFKDGNKQQEKELLNIILSAKK